MDKQIEEMARVICGFACDYENCDICPHNCINVPCEYHDYAMNLLNAGYRKESETAKDILKWLIEHTFESCILETYFKERYGVEVADDL